MRYLLAVVAVLVLAAGCTGASHPDESGAVGVGRAAAPPAPAQSKTEANGPGATTVVPVPGQDRDLARTAQLAMTVADVRIAAEQARGIAVAAGGYSGSEHTDATSASLSLMVPSDKLDTALSRLSGLGKVTSSQQTAQDVTDQVVDVESRLETARRSVDRLRALLDRATSVSDVASVESQLTTRESDLESLEARQKALAGQVAMSTVDLTATATPPVAEQKPESGFLAGLAAGWRGFLIFGRGVLNVLGAVLPFVLLLGIPVVAVGYLARRRGWFRPRSKKTPTA